MDTQLLLEGLSKAAWIVGGSAAILGIFALLIMGFAWLWLKVAKWLSVYIQRASGEFREAFKQVNGGKVLRLKKSRSPLKSTSGCPLKSDIKS